MERMTTGCQVSGFSPCNWPTDWNDGYLGLLKRHNNRDSIKSDRLVWWKRFATCVPEFLGSNLGWNTGCSAWWSPCFFFHFLFLDITYIRSQPLPSKSSPIHLSSVYYSKICKYSQDADITSYIYIYFPFTDWSWVIGKLLASQEFPNVL